MASQPTQELPYWLSASTMWLPNPTGGTASIYRTTVVNLPLTYYGPSIPLGAGWTYGGLTSPVATSSIPSTALTTASTTFTTSPRSSATPSTALSTTFPLSSQTSTSILSSSSIFLATTSSPSTTSLQPTSSLTSTSQSTPTLQAAEGSRNGLLPGSIAAIVIAAIAFTVTLLLILFVLLRRRKRRLRPRGRDLRIDISGLPPGPGEERGSLLAGRANGGESPEMVENEEGFLTVPGQYRAVGTAEPSTSNQDPVHPDPNEIGVAYGSGIPIPSSQSGSSHGSGNSSVASRDLFYPSNRSDAPPSPFSGNVELMTAQRGTRNRWTRFGRLSWFGLNRNTVASSTVANAGDDENDVDDSISVPAPTQKARREPRRHSTPNLLMIKTPQPQSAPLPSPPSLKPPPASFSKRLADASSRRTSAQSTKTSQSGQTIFYDASSQLEVATSRSDMPSARGKPSGQLLSHQLLEQSEPGTSSTAEFPNISPVVAWPQFPSSPNSPTSETGSGGLPSPFQFDDVLDQPPPTASLRSITKKQEHAAPFAPSRLSAAWEPESAPGSDDVHELLLNEEPPTASDAWRRSIRRDLPLDVEDDSDDESNEVTRRLSEIHRRGSVKRFTMGQAVFVDTPRISTHPEIASMHGDRGGTIGSHSVDSRYSVALTHISPRSVYSPPPVPTGKVPHSVETSLSSNTSRNPSDRQAISPFATGSELGGRIHSMSALRGASTPPRKDDTRSSGGTNAGRLSSTDAGSLLYNPETALTMTEPSEMGEISPKKFSPRKDRQGDAPPPVVEEEPSISRPPSVRLVGKSSRVRSTSPPLGSAASSFFPDTEALAPPPAKRWWRPF